MPLIYGIRHLSPAGAHNLLRLLEEKQPELLLVEGPSDLSGLMEQICRKEVTPPIAMMAYSETVPIETILYPFADYSPEYQAIQWAYRNGKTCRFMDLPASVFLAFGRSRRVSRPEEEREEPAVDVYAQIAELAGEPDQETYWERQFEHSTDGHAYWLAAAEYGRQLRACTADSRADYAENLIREAYMKRTIDAAVKEGFADEKIVAICGSFHVEGLETCAPMTDQEEKSLPRVPCKQTLMPYSYYRLSSMSGYGAGNKAPAYYGMLWDAIRHGDLESAAYRYLSGIAGFQRKNGGLSSSAEVIEAVRLAMTLAGMKGGGAPTLRDLQDAAVACIGHGSWAELADAFAAIEVGTQIGSLPEGVSQTSVQEDFVRRLKDLKLEKYKTLVAQPLELDLRENTRVKTEKAAFLDLERSFFLHRMLTLGIHFVQKERVVQDKATWAERWTLQWTPEAEIEIVEAALKGDTIELAAAFVFQERLREASSIADTAKVIDDACFCGLPETVRYATSVLQGLAVDAASVREVADTAWSLSAAIRYGSIRRLDPAPLEPLLQQLFLRACLILPGGCACNNSAVGEIIEAMGLLNEIAIHHDGVDQERWLTVLAEISGRDDLNTKASGYATAILLERGKLDSALLSVEVQRRLSKGIPADLGAGWFEGLALKNRHALIARLSLWEQLDGYLDTLDETEFKRALVFLRRAFSEFTSGERRAIAENLGELWGVDEQQAGEVLVQRVNEQEQEALAELDDFDFGDL